VPHPASLQPCFRTTVLDASRHAIGLAVSLVDPEPPRRPKPARTVQPWLADYVSARNAEAVPA
jgi:hypothetical protein